MCLYISMYRICISILRCMVVIVIGVVCGVQVQSRMKLRFEEDDRIRDEHGFHPAASYSAGAQRAE